MEHGGLFGDDGETTRQPTKARILIAGKEKRRKERKKEREGKKKKENYIQKLRIKKKKKLQPLKWGEREKKGGLWLVMGTHVGDGMAQDMAWPRRILGRNHGRDGATSGGRWRA